VLASIRRAHQFGKRATGTVRVIDADTMEFQGPPGTVVAAVEAEYAARRRPAVRKEEPVDLERTWRGGGGDELRKRAPGPLAVADEARALALVKRLHAEGGTVEGSGEKRDLAKGAATPRVPIGALRDAERERDRLRDLRKGTPVEYRDDAHLQEAEHLAKALAEPVPRAPYLAPEPAPPASWTPHLGDAAVGEQAAVLAGANPAEVRAAVRDGDGAWLERLYERSVVDAIKAVRPIRCGSAPPRFGTGA